MASVALTVHEVEFTEVFEAVVDGGDVAGEFLLSDEAAMDGLNGTKDAGFARSEADAGPECVKYVGEFFGERNVAFAFALGTGGSGRFRFLFHLFR